MTTPDELYTPEKREEVKKRNFLSLPRWMRDFLDGEMSFKKHNRNQEIARRVAQIRSGVLKPENRGTVRMK